MRAACAPSFAARSRARAGRASDTRAAAARSAGRRPRCRPAHSRRRWPARARPRPRGFRRAPCAGWRRPRPSWLAIVSPASASTSASRTRNAGFPSTRTSMPSWIGAALTSSGPPRLMMSSSRWPAASARSAGVVPRTPTRMVVIRRFATSRSAGLPASAAGPSCEITGGALAAPLSAAVAPPVAACAGPATMHAPSASERRPGQPSNPDVKPHGQAPVKP